MIRSLVRRIDGDEGLTLVELSVGALIASLALGMMVTWAMTVIRAERYQSDDFDALNSIRHARSVMVKEVRFADGLLPVSGPDAVDVWIDLDDSGGGSPDQPGEWVTFQIIGSQLVRYEDGDPSATQVLADHVLAASSHLTVTGSVIEIELTADVDADSGPSERTERTRVSLRNG